MKLLECRDMQFSSAITFFLIFAGCAISSLAQQQALQPVTADQDKKRAAQVDGSAGLSPKLGTRDWLVGSRGLAINQFEINSCYS